MCLCSKHVDKWLKLKSNIWAEKFEWQNSTDEKWVLIIKDKIWMHRLSGKNTYENSEIIVIRSKVFLFMS